MLLKYNLQFFAKDGPGGEKTEPATGKKLSKARSDGQVAKSKEIGNSLGLISLFLCLKIWIGDMGNSFLETFYMIYTQIPEFVTLVEGELSLPSMSYILGQAIMQMFTIVAPIFLIGFLVAFLGDYAQVKWKPTSKPLKPKASKLNPLKGMKKLLSPSSIVELVKSILKIALIFYVVSSYLEDKWKVIFSFYDMPLEQALLIIGDIVIDLGLRIALFYMLIGVGDFIYQKVKFKKDMKMTKQEVKDEYKNAEGDPAVKGKIRQKMREISQRRMMKDLPRADVVITNPTHFAVAILYDQEKSEAPIVLAKGQDYLAQRIKEKAKENKIEIVENKPLARMLYYNVEVGAVVPPELYQGVAEVLAMVYKLQGKT